MNTVTISYNYEKNIQQKLENFPKTMTSKQYFKRTSVHKFFKNKCIQDTGSPNSYICTRNLDP